MTEGPHLSGAALLRSQVSVYYPHSNLSTYPNPVSDNAPSPGGSGENTDVRPPSRRTDSQRHVAISCRSQLVVRLQATGEMPSTNPFLEESVAVGAAGRCAVVGYGSQPRISDMAFRSPGRYDGNGSSPSWSRRSESRIEFAGRLAAVG